MSTPPQSRRWVWFFAVLALLAGAGITIPIVYNSLRQQLTREELDAAVQRWQERGPRSYNFRYVVKRVDAEPDVYQSEVRNGRVVSAYHNGRRLEPDKSLWHDMEHRFSDIRGFMDEDAKPGKPRVFVTAQFDATDGRLLQYIRSVTGTRQGIEIDVHEVKPVSEGAPAGNARP